MTLKQLLTNVVDKVNQAKIEVDNLPSTVFPVGYVYISFVNTSPASMFGGTWTQLTNVFPRFASDTTTGGSDTVTLTTSEMPSHSHRSMMWSENSGSYFGANSTSGGGTWRLTYASGACEANYYTNRVGGGSAHNNMPYYQNMYAWKRTA